MSSMMVGFISLYCLGEGEGENEQPEDDDNEPSQGINVVTDEQPAQDTNEITSHMFDNRLSENDSERILKKKTEKAKPIDAESKEHSKQLDIEDQRSQDSIIEYEKIISEKLELKRKEELK